MSTISVKASMIIQVIIIPNTMISSDDAAMVVDVLRECTRVTVFVRVYPQ